MKLKKRELKALIDEFGLISEKIGPDIKRLKALRDILDIQIGDGMAGNIFQITVDTYTQKKLNTKQIRATMSAKWIEKHEMEIPIRKFNVKKLRPKKSNGSKCADRRPSPHSRRPV